MQLRNRNCRGLVVAALVVGVACLSAGCAPVPFSTPSRGLEALDEEAPYYFGEPETAMAALSTSDHPELSDRVRNLFATYEAELAIAEKAQGGIVNKLLGISALVLPLAGVASSIALSDPSDVETVSVATSSATAAILGVNMIFKPEAKAARASRCEAFLRSALETLEAHWERNDLTALEGTPEQWRLYLSQRSTLDIGKRCACEG